MIIKGILALLFGGLMGFLISHLFLLHDYFHAGIATAAYLSIMVRFAI